MNSVPAAVQKPKLSFAAKLPNPLAKIDLEKPRKLLLKLVIVFGFLLLSIIALLIFAYFTKLDRSIFQATISGKVVDSLSNAGIANAQVKINDKTIVSNLDGSFSLSDYFKDEITISASAEKYKVISEKVTLARGFLTFNFYAELKLLPDETGILSGKFISDTPYDFIEDKLYINKQEVKINKDGTFTASNLEKGENIFEYKSLKYKDINKKIEVLEGNNTLADIKIEPAGDISGKFFDWVNESTPIRATIEATNVSESQISVLEDGNFNVQDLEVGLDYTLKISHKDYLTREYTLKVLQGSNQIFDLRMVPNDVIASFVKRSDDGKQIFRSAIDGKNEEAITSIKSFDPSAIYHDNKFIFFRDDYERIRGIGSGSIQMGYSLDLSTKVQSRLTSSASQLQSFYYYYSAGKLINILTTKNSNGSQVKMEIRDIDGSNPKVILEGVDLNITNLIVTNQQGEVFYTLRKADSKIEDLYKWDLDSELNKLLITDEEIQFYDVSDSGQRLLFTRKNSQTGFEDLAVLDVETLATRILLQNHDGSYYKFEQDSADLFYFVATRENRNNLYKYDLKSNETKRITFIDPGQEITSFYIVDRYIFYTIDESLYVLDKNIPLNYKLVTKDIED